MPATWIDSPRTPRWLAGGSRGLAGCVLWGPEPGLAALATRLVGLPTGSGLVETSLSSATRGGWQLPLTPLLLSYAGQDAVAVMVHKDRKKTLSLNQSASRTLPWQDEDYDARLYKTGAVARALVAKKSTEELPTQLEKAMSYSSTDFYWQSYDNCRQMKIRIHIVCTGKVNCPKSNALIQTL